MFLIDRYAYTNKLKNVHPGEKVLFTALTMLITLASDKAAVHLAIVLIVLLAVVTAGGIPLKTYICLLLLPLSFIIIGILPVIVSISAEKSTFLYSIRLFNSFIGLSEAGIENGLLAASRSFAAVSNLYFLSLTTPLLEIMQLLKMAKLPAVVIELMFIIYRFIFVLIDASATIYNSQSSRLGYTGIGNSFKSLGKLMVMVFLKAYNHSQVLYASMISRGYDGSIGVINKDYSLSISNVFVIAMIEILLIMLHFVFGGY